MKKVITKETIQLGEAFGSIKSEILSKDTFEGLSRIISFNKGHKTITYKTEKIHPDCVRKKQIPVLLLFSNPHPLSVQNGLFLSEPSSRLFWKRLFDCRQLNIPDHIKSKVENWSKNTPKDLSAFLLTGQSGIDFALFFDCLESLPTNQYSHLKKIFKGKIGRSIRQKRLITPGLDNLVEMSSSNNISSWIVFSVEAYRTILKKQNAGKNAPKRIRTAINQYLLDKDKNRFWKSLGDLKNTISIGSKSIPIYLALIARYKNWKIQTGGRYFTIMLELILNDILSTRSKSK